MKAESGRLLLNRMRPLRYSESAINRVALLTKLSQHSDTHLIIIHAPAGYGKTTLLSQYHAGLQNRSINCGWLTLDNTGDDPVQFLAYFIASLDNTGLISREILDAAFHGFHGLEENQAFNLIVNSLSGLETSVYFLLDDHHLLVEKNSQKLLQMIIESTFQNTHFVITSRESPTSLKGRLQLSGSYFELTSDDLALTQAETRDYLNLSGQAEFTDELIKLLHEKTEGWPAAIEFSKTWLSKNSDIQIDSFINQSSDFTTFLMTEIFSNLPATTQEVMLRTSIVNELNGDVINALCLTNSGWKIMNDLFQRDLVIPLDENRNWYRYHHLLYEFLLDRFKKESSIDANSLHRSMANWYLERNNTAEALRHAMASREPNFLASVTERAGGWHYILDGRISTLIKILERLPDDVLRNYPSTYLGYLLLIAKSGNTSEAVEMYKFYREATQNFTVVNGSPLSPSFIVEASVVDFFLAALEDRPQTPLHIAKMEAVLKGVSKKDHFLQAILFNFLCYAYFDNSSFDKAYRAGESSIFHFKELRSIYGENYMYFHLGKICLVQGRLHDAEQLYNEGYQLATENFGIDSDMAAIAAAHLTEVCYEKNDFEQAKEYLKVAFPRIEQSEAWFDVYLSAYMTAANIAQVLESTNNTATILRNASLTGKRRNIRRLRLFTMMRYIRLLIKENKLLKAKWNITRLHLNELMETDMEKEFVNHRIVDEAGLTLAYYHIKNNAPDDAIEIIEPLLNNAKRNNSRRSLISLLYIITLAYYKSGKHKQALTKLNEAVSHAMFEGFKRPFIEFSDEQQDILQRALSDSQLFPINRLKRSFLIDLIHITDREDNKRKSRSSKLLTIREQEIADYVCDGYSNKEIARLCGCTENTVKFHLKNIFTKLGIRSRKTLSRIAR